MTRNTHIPDEPYAVRAHAETVFMLRPEATEIRITTVAHHLSQLNRFTGGAVYPYSVAEHSLHVMHIAQRVCPSDPGVALAALLHDAHEAYVGDVSRPVQRAMTRLDGGRAFRELDAAWSARVRAVFGVPWDARIQEIVKHADHVALMTERHALVPPSLAWPDMPERDRDDAWFEYRAPRLKRWGGNSWRNIRDAFLCACDELGVGS
jgi:hypothetical protein